MNGLVFRHPCRDDGIDLIALFAAGEYIAIHDALVQIRAGKTLFRQMFSVFVRFMRNRHMRARVSFLAALLPAGFLAQALRIRLVKAIT